jgi:hypothetical protein
MRLEKANKLAAKRQTAESGVRGGGIKSSRCLLHFLGYSGVVQLVARQPLELVILVRVQAPEPHLGEEGSFV